MIKALPAFAISASEPRFAAALTAAGVRVYSRRDAMWLLTPACMEPPRDAQRAYGPLAYAGSFSTDALSARELELVQLEFDAAFFARIPARTARRLLGGRLWARLLRAWLRLGR